MILHISPDAPAIVHLAAATALYTHIGAGFLGMTSGFVAMAAPKGGRVHRMAGNVFFVAMLTMAGLGAVIAPLLPQRIASTAGLLTFYLVATAWVTIRRPQGAVGRFEIGGLLLALATAAVGVTFGSMALASPTHTLEGLPYAPAFLFAGFALFGAVGDLRTILRKGVSGPQRLIRHIWRMSVALLIATLSFVSQPAAVPDAIEGSPFLFLPILAVLVVAIYWLVRTRFPGLFRRRRANVLKLNPAKA
jgi:uncharacterized membrane protein